MELQVIFNKDNKDTFSLNMEFKSATLDDIHIFESSIQRNISYIENESKKQWQGEPTYQNAEHSITILKYILNKLLAEQNKHHVSTLTAK